MRTWPLKFRELSQDELLFVDDAGGYFRADGAFLERYALGALAPEDRAFLERHGHSFEAQDDLQFTGFVARWAQRLSVPGRLDYVILVPTLRCNLTCDYCQVSRVAETARGFDWSDATLQAVLDWLGVLETDAIKVEFQGGEPTLRLDLMRAVRDYCRARFDHSEFVVCTNLQNLSEEAWDFFASPDTHISTSFDGTVDLHRQQRTKSDGTTSEFLRNIQRALALFGPERVSALPTIDAADPPAPEDVIAAFAGLGLRSIYLRRVNYQGFARKRYGLADSADAWTAYYRRFVKALIAYNATAEEPFEEYYMAHLLRRILRGRHNGHVDLRNPNWVGRDYLVIDYDGTFYPSDEARMVTRIGQVDLSIGSLGTGLDREKLTQLESEATHLFDPDCQHCSYQAFCGPDVIDDLSRYGRIDLPRPLTAHCQTHLGLFDLAFELLYSADPSVQRTLGLWLRVPELSPRLAPRLS